MRTFEGAVEDFKARHGFEPERLDILEWFYVRGKLDDSEERLKEYSK